MKVVAILDEHTCNDCRSRHNKDHYKVGYPPFHGPQGDDPGCRCVCVIGPDVITIDKDTPFSTIEVYKEWYVCPSCRVNAIGYEDNYCSNCGVGVKWDIPNEELGIFGDRK